MSKWKLNFRFETKVERILGVLWDIIYYIAVYVNDSVTVNYSEFRMYTPNPTIKRSIMYGTCEKSIRLLNYLCIIKGIKPLFSVKIVYYD